VRHHFDVRQKIMIDSDTWSPLAASLFPELKFESDDSAPDALSVCEDLAYAADAAHQTPVNPEFLARCYEFIRWSIHNTEDQRLKGLIADWFFDRVLSLPFSKSACLDFLDWGDVEVLRGAFTVEPSFDDTSNFEILCVEWRSRWARNQKLPHPRIQEAEQDETQQPLSAALFT
jgi:hypothetical protein